MKTSRKINKFGATNAVFISNTILRMAGWKINDELLLEITADKDILLKNLTKTWRDNAVH